MKTKSSAALLGLFVIVAIFIAVAMLMALKGKRLFANNPTYTLQIDRSLKGLNVGAMVTFRGGKVGQVTNIVLMPLNTINFLKFLLQRHLLGMLHRAEILAAESNEEDHGYG